MRQAAVTAADRADSRQRPFILGRGRWKLTRRLSQPKVEIQSNGRHARDERSCETDAWQSVMKTVTVTAMRRDGKWKRKTDV